jgi:hypothetical protein
MQENLGSPTHYVSLFSFNAVKVETPLSSDQRIKLKNKTHIFLKHSIMKNINIICYFSHPDVSTKETGLSLDLYHGT